METVLVPQTFTSFINKKLEKNGQAGRPHFLQELAAGRDVQNEVLNILELTWIKNRSLGSIARRYKTSYHTIYRLVRDLEPYKRQLAEFLKSRGEKHSTTLPWTLPTMKSCKRTYEEPNEMESKVTEAFSNALQKSGRH